MKLIDNNIKNAFSSNNLISFLFYSLVLAFVKEAKLAT